MRRPEGNRARLGAISLALAAALAMLALPALASSHGGPGGDHADAGTIQSFDVETGVLTIDLAAGGSVSGLVVPRTHIRCDRGRGHHHGLDRGKRRQRGAQASRRGGEAEPGDDSRDPGRAPDNPVRGHEPGEDPPGHDGTAPGHSEGPGQGAEHRHHRCGPDDLVAGATVKVAELVLFDGKAFYKLVGLQRQASAEPSPEAPTT